MRVMTAVLSLVACFAFLVGTAVQAGPFEPMFTVLKIEGDCTVSPPDAAEFTTAMEGSTYPYGTKVRTGRSSSAVIRFSEGNECRLLANAMIVVTEDVKDKKLKTIKLSAGKVEVNLEKAFQEHSGLNIETPAAICGAIECIYSVEAGTDDEADAYVGHFATEEGKIRVFGPNYEIPELDAGDNVSISTTRDGMSTRIRCRAGTFQLRVKNADGEPRLIDMKQDMVVKIFRERTADGTVVVTIMIVLPDGTNSETWSYSDTLGEGEGPVELPQVEEVEGEPSDTTGQDDDGWVTTTTTTTSTTTTTTIPSFTPVGTR